MHASASFDSKPCVLVVEDRVAEREALARFLRTEDLQVRTAANAPEALKFLYEPIDLVISDLCMGPQSGIDLLRSWRERQPGTPFIILTAFGQVETAVAAMKLGAEEFITKPVDPIALLGQIRVALSKSPRACDSEAVRLINQAFGAERIIGASQAMIQVCETTLRAARTQSTVLILGESGTGKELIAEAIHYNSDRKNAPFVVVNMAAIPDALVESELFGHVRGAFTNAVASREGRFEAAQGGTLFIDEIGDFPLGLQAKLLRVLESRVVSRIGCGVETAIDVRVVAATSRPLREMKDSGAFREDLFYRLNVIDINLPPLRDRRQDIPLLARHLLRLVPSNPAQPSLSIAPDLMRALENYDWPGNVRQLRNCIERMVAMARQDVLTLADLPEDMRESERVFANEGQRLENIKRSAIEDALYQFGGNRTRAAEFLGISVRTLQRKLRQWHESSDGPSLPSQS